MGLDYHFINSWSKIHKYSYNKIITVVIHYLNIYIRQFSNCQQIRFSFCFSSERIANIILFAIFHNDKYKCCEVCSPLCWHTFLLWWPLLIIGPVKVYGLLCTNVLLPACCLKRVLQYSMALHNVILSRRHLF